MPIDNDDVLIPARHSSLRDAMGSCALAGNPLAVELLYTIRRLEAGEPVGAGYVKQLERFMEDEDGDRNA